MLIGMEVEGATSKNGSEDGVCGPRVLACAHPLSRKKRVCSKEGSHKAVSRPLCCFPHVLKRVEQTNTHDLLVYHNVYAIARRHCVPTTSKASQHFGVTG